MRPGVQAADQVVDVSSWQPPVDPSFILGEPRRIGRLRVVLRDLFNAVRGKGTLNCPAEIGYESAVSVLKVNEAIEAKVPLAFAAAEFKI